MKISREWLNDYIDLGGLSDEQIAARMTEIGHAVEAIEQHGSDAVFEVEFTTNRIDAMSHRGLARELAAALGREAKTTLNGTLPEARSAISVEIEAPEMCGRFSGLVVRGVSVKPSSPAVQRRLEAVGLRPINNVVDATNYVMLALGHPMHAYDMHRIAGGRIIVRRGAEGEKFKTLDGVERAITSDTCMIADGERSVGIGGVMGGENSEISAQTKDVFLECAWFDPSTIRRTARRLGMKTDASYRFERGADPNDGPEVLLEAARLIEAEGGGAIEGSIDVVASAVQPRRVSLRETRLREQSAGAIGLGYALDLFRRLRMQADGNGERIDVVVPTYRVDIHEEQDLVEEVLRFYGFNSIPVSLPSLTTGDVRREPLAELEETMRDLLTRFGLSEAITYSFIHPAHNAVFTSEQAIDLDNALTENVSSMRLSMLPGLLQAVSHNRSYGTRDGGLYEVGRTYHRQGDAITERRSAAFVLFGQKPAAWGEAKHSWDYFDAKGVVEAVASQLRVGIEVESAEREGYRTGQTARVLAGERVVGTIGALTPAALQHFEIKGDVIAGELDLGAMLESMSEWKMSDVSRFPGVPMVVGMFHDRSLSYSKIAEQIRAMNLPHLREVGLWDRFVPKDAADGEVKTALGLWYQSTERSLTQEEVAEVHNQLTARLAEALPVRIITQ